MNTPIPPDSGLPPRTSAAAYLDAMARWADLAAELSELHARLEYVRLMLRLGVSPGPGTP